MEYTHIINTQLEYTHHASVVNHTYYRKVFNDQMPMLYTENFDTPTTLAEVLTKIGLDPIAFSFTRDGRGTAFLEDPDGNTAILLAAHYESINISIASKNEERLEEIRDLVREICPKAEVKETTVPVHFWMLTDQGPSQRRRNLDIVTWDEVQRNYPERVQSSMQEILRLQKPEVGGKLMVWHGPPGTGKTYGIRALIKEWSAWADIHYIVDPEKFFGEASYLMSTLMAEPDDDDRWRLLILEDTGELMNSDAKKRTGQGLSRLLNVADGLIGQGLKLLILITTNEKIHDLHPAVSRAGRCIANVEFPAFKPAEAAEWLGNDIPIPKKETVLADLYEMKEQHHIKAAEVKVTSGQYL